MLRTINTVFCNKIAQLPVVQVQALRWKRQPRKPFWLPKAKSKMFQVQIDPILPPEEEDMINELYRNYRNAMKSYKAYFRELDELKSSKQASGELATEEEIEESLRRNEEWNVECARRREERLALADAKHSEIAARIIEKTDRDRQQLMEKIEELVRVEKENSKYFVTKENLDEKIEECLDSSTDYNYAIDLEGNMYTGYETEMKQVNKSDDGDKKQASESV